MRALLEGIVPLVVLWAFSIGAVAESQTAMPGTDTRERNLSGRDADPISRVNAATTHVAEAEEGDKPGFAVHDYVVEGNTILSSEKIGEILSRHTGDALTIREIEQARLALEKAYHAAGYPTVLVVIPEQTIDQGRVRLLVVEGRLSNITVTGNSYYSRYNILGKLPSLRVGELLYEPAFVKELDRINAIPDLKLAPVLKPGQETGQVDLELKVKDRLPLHARIQADNRGPITTPRDRLVAEAQYANLFDEDHILTVQTVQTPTDWGAVENYGASYVAPIFWPNHLLALYASYSRANSVLAGQTLAVGTTGNIAVAGNAIIAGIRYLFPIGGSQAVGTHQLSVGIDYKDLRKTMAEFPAGLGTVVVQSPVRYTPASVSYTGLIPDGYGVTKVSAAAKGYVAGLIPGGEKADFGGDPADPFNHPGQRVGSTGTFAVLQGGVDRIQPLPADFGLVVHADGQWGSQPLIPAEQYFAGGMDTVRGYSNFETAGDNAVRGRAEVTTPELLAIPIDRIWQRRRSAEFVARLRLAAFYDAAQLWVQRPQPGQIDRFRLEGTGFGLRMKFPKDFGELQLDQGWALQTTPTTKRGDTFVHFSVSLAF